MAVSPITNLPINPKRTDPDSVFVPRADGWVAALTLFTVEMNTSIGQINTDVIAAAASAANAIAAANAVEWITGTTITKGDGRWSPTDFQSYRAKNDLTTIQNVNDPSSDPTNWAQLSAAAPASSPLPAKFLAGLGMSNNAIDALKDLDIATGAAMDSTDAKLLTLAAAITKQLDVTWAPGNDAGGFASGATLSGTYFHVFIVEVAGAVDIMADDDFNCLNGVTNNAVTAFRRIGSLMVLSGNIRKFFQSENTIVLDVVKESIQTNLSSSAAQLVNMEVPGDIELIVIGHFAWTSSSVNRTFIFTSPDQTDTAPDTVNFFSLDMDSSMGRGSQRIRIKSNTIRQIRYRCNVATSITVRLFTEGYIDARDR